MKKNIGTYKGSDLSNLNYKFEKGDKWWKLKTRKWVAAVSFNTILNYNDFLVSKGMSKLPDGIRLYLAKSRKHHPPTSFEEFDFIRKSDATCEHLIGGFDFQSIGIATIIGGGFYGVGIGLVIGGAIASNPVGWGVGLVLIAGGMIITPANPDIVIDYAVNNLATLNSSNLSLNVSQQLGIVFLQKSINITGSDNFSKYLAHTNLINNAGPNQNYWPFGSKSGNGSCCYNFPDLVAIWQMFAQHMAHENVDYMYGSSQETFKLQGIDWVSDFGSSGSKKYLEAFNPNPQSPTDDYFSWIPVGLINDLMDTNNEPFPVNDQVSGFTYSEIQNAFTSNPSTVVELKNKLVSIKPSQSIQINALFASYGY